jgi:hypothetical protein
MIELHAIQDHDYSSRLKERLKDLVVTHEVILHEPAEIEKPFIKEGERVLDSKEKIERWFLQLEKELNWQRSLSGDGCYIDPESGEVC